MHPPAPHPFHNLGFLMDAGFGYWGRQCRSEVINENMEGQKTLPADLGKAKIEDLGFTFFSFLFLFWWMDRTSWHTDWR